MPASKSPRPLSADPSIVPLQVKWGSIMSPHAIHAHGLLFVIDPTTLTFRRISENLVEVFAKSAEDFLGKPVQALFGIEIEDQIKAAVLLPRIETANPLEIRMDVFHERLIFEAVLSRAKDGNLEQAVILELTEKPIELLNALRQKGFLISIDDFGTGFSSLAYVQQLPIHELKIDRSFTRHIVHSPRDYALVSSIINLAHELGIKAVVEGIETIEQFNLLQQAKADAMQGYLFSRPVPPKEFPGW